MIEGRTESDESSGFGERDVSDADLVAVSCILLEHELVVTYHFPLIASRH